MAKKVDKKLDEFTWDDELDSFDFDFPDPTMPDDRKPIDKFKSGLNKGIKLAIENPIVIKNSLKAALPRNIGPVIDSADEANKALRSLYDESAKQIKPLLEQGKRLTAKYVPADSKIVPKAFQDMLKRWREEEKRSYEQNTSGDRDALISANLAEIFGQQALLDQKRSAEETTRTKIRQGVEDIRHNTMATLLNRISIATTGQFNYTTNVAHKYYQKSLELQYKSVYATQDIVKTLAEESAKQREMLLAIIKNTALPDAVKINGAEMRREMARRRVYDSINAGLFGQQNKSIEKIIENISKKVQASVTESASSMMLALSVGEMIGDQASMLGDKYDTSGQLFGSMAVEEFSEPIFKKLGKRLRNSSIGKKLKLGERSQKLATGYDNLPRRLEEFRKSNKYTFDDSLKGSILSAIQGYLPSNAIQTSVSFAGVKNMEEPFYITKRTDRSLNEVIPGYLARILREVKIIRSGDAKTPLVQYDYGRGKFSNDAGIRASITNAIIPKESVRRTQEGLENILKQIDPNETLDPDVKQALKRRLLINSTSSNLGSKERLADASQYDDDPIIAAKAASIMEEFFKNSNQDTLSSFQFAHNRLGDEVTDSRSLIQDYINAGHSDQLKTLGIVDEDVRNIDLRKILDLYLLNQQNVNNSYANQTGQASVNMSGAAGASSTFNNFNRAVIQNNTGSANTGDATSQQNQSQIPFDIYFGKETIPRIRRWLFNTGQYFKRNGEPVSSIEDLNEALTDADGNSVLAEGEIVDGYFINFVNGIRTKVSDTFSKIKTNVGKKSFYDKLNFRKNIEKYTGNLTGMFRNIKNKFEDLYVKGEAEPRVTAAEMKAGAIHNEAGEPIKDISEISGNLYDQDGHVRLRKEELSNVVFFNARIAKWSPLWAIGKVGQALWKYQTEIAPGMAARNLKRLWSVYKTVGSQGWRAAKWMLGFRVNNFPQDCYLKGEVNPRLYGVVMKNGGYFSADGKTVISTPAQITGAVVDVNGQYVLTEEEYRAGLYNIEGRKISTTAIGRLIKSVVGFPFKVAGTIAKTSYNVAANAAKLAAQGASEVGKAGLKALGYGARGLGYAMGIRYEGSKEERQALLEKRKAAKGDYAQTDEERANIKMKNLDLDKASNAVHGNFGRIRTLFGLNRQDSISLQSAGLLSQILSELRKQKEETAETPTDKIKKKGGGLLAAMKSVFSSKKKEESKEDGDGVSLADAKAGLDLAKDGARGVKGLFGKAISLGGKLLGAGGMLGGLGSALASTGAAATGALSGLGAALAAAGSSIAAVLSSPVVISAAAAALVGYGAYKAYKYFTRGKLSSIGKLRMTQYGFKPSDESWAKRMVDLEATIVPGVRINQNGKMGIDWKKVSAKELMEKVGLDPLNMAQRDPFEKWMKNRFLPVLFTHLTAAQAYTGKISLETPEDLKGVDRNKYINAVAFLEGPYNVSDLPIWPRGTISATTSEDVKEALQEALKDTAQLAKPTIQKVVEAAVPAAVASQMPAKKTPAEMSIGAETSTMAKLSITATAQIGVNALSDGTRVDALEAIRLKAYGVIDLEPSKVQSIRVLEKIVSARLNTISKDAKVSWSDDALNVIDRVSTSFGISDTRSESAKTWLKWFNNRFMPIYLNYQTGYYAKTGKLAYLLQEGNLKPADQLEIAKIIVGTAGAWSVTDTPWPNYVLGVDANIVQSNITFIQDMAGKAVLEEQKKVAAKNTAAKPATKTVTTAATAVRQTDVKPVAPMVPPDAEQAVKAAGASKAEDLPTQAVKSAGGPISDGRNANTYIALSNDAKLDGLNNQFKEQLFGAIEEYGIATGKRVPINDAFRTYQDQINRKKKYGDRAASPGSSVHEYGMAVDIDAAILNEMDKLGLLRKYGLIRPVGQEPWHLEPIGIQDNLARYKNDPEAASQAIKAGLGKGGGGWGTVAAAKKYTRNIELSKQIASSSSTPSEPIGYEATIASAGTMRAVVSRRSSVENKEDEVKQPTAMPNPYGAKPNAVEAVKAAMARKSSGGAYTQAGRTIIAQNDPEFNPGQTNGANDPEFPVPAPTGEGYDGLKDTVISAAKKVGVDPNMLLQTIAVESDFKPNAAPGTSRAFGLGQFTPDTWRETIQKHGKQYGYNEYTDRSDPVASALMTAHYIKDNLASIRKEGNVTAVDAYLTHFMGPRGANMFLEQMRKNPDAIAARSFPAQADNNRSIFYSNDGRPRTLSGVYDELTSRIRAKSKRYGIDDSNLDSTTKPGGNDTQFGVNRPTGQQAATNPTISAPRVPIVIPRPVQPSAMPSISPDRGVARINDTEHIETLKSVAAYSAQQLDVQKQILSFVKAIAERKDSESTKEITPQPTKPEETNYTVPPVPVPMNRYR